MSGCCIYTHNDQGRVFVGQLFTISEISTTKDCEVEFEEKPKFPLPVVDQPCRAANEHPIDSPTVEHLQDIQPCHDCLSGAGIIGKQKSEGGVREKVFVDRDSLMRERDNAGQFKAISLVKEMPIS